MKKIICKVTYDTDNSKIVEKRTYGSYGDPSGYEETLYITENGKYFLYTNGGQDSKHSSENIKRMSKDAADNWISNN